MRPLQVPGHKSRFAEGGADDKADTGGYLTQAETLWALAVGGDHARFLVGGSPQANITSLVAAGGPSQGRRPRRHRRGGARSGL